MLPYLFLLGADVLQRLIKQDGCVRHPIADEPCPVMQYTEDTLLLVRAATEDILHLRAILDMFTSATGLRINFSKSTVVPMNVPAPRLRRLLRVLQCQEASFPQVYLGLPLSNFKLNMSAFTPLIAIVDKRLAGWKALLLNHVGRLTLIKSVLDGLPTYLMAALALPAGTVAAIDQRRRVFLWSGCDSTNGAKCLVAWERACLSKEDGGLGICQLHAQNACLLLKLLHRLHHPAGSSWAT